MFSKNDKNESKGNGASRESRVAPSIISANLHVVGNLKSDGEVQVDGTVQGDVAGLSLAIGERAKVTGELVAEEIVVRGIIEGRIKAKRVQLTKTAKVIGDIWHEVLSIESGAHVEGHIKRLDSETRKTTIVAEPDKPLARIAAAADHGAGAQAVLHKAGPTRAN